MRSEFPRNSLASIVLDSAERPAPKPVARRTLKDGSLGAIVLGPGSARSGLFLATSLALALALHGGVGLAAIASHNGGSGRAPAPAKRTLRIDHLVALDPTASPPLPAAAARAPAKEPPVTKAPARAQSATEPPKTDTPPPPTKAGQILAADATTSQAALDFTGFASGDGPQYVGGLTASSGTSVTAVRGAVAANGATAAPRSAPSRARPVGRPSLDWDCPWPAEAAALSIDEQYVVIRALVRPDGSVASTELISDPGHGFGRVALACGKKQRFPPAADDAGNPILATSRPIRIRFTRP